MSLLSQQILCYFVMLVVPYVLWTGHGQALPLYARSVTLSSSAPSAVVTNDFRFSFNSTAWTGSMVFNYCSNDSRMTSPCDPPLGLDVSGAVLSQQGGNTGFTINTVETTPNKLVLSRTLAPASPVSSRYVFDNIINPSDPNTSAFVRISTHNSVDGTGSYANNGSVAFSTAPNFLVETFVPPFLDICVGITVALDCSQVSGDSLDFGILSNRLTRAATSQVAASTNDVNGYSLYVLGSTMTSGNNIIPALVQAPGQVGNSAFGLNLRQNSNPSIGTDPVGVGTATPSPGYNNPNIFSFVEGSQVASSTLSTDYNRMTVSYIVNVSGNQPPGVYSTTLTYLAAVQF
jgi:hypothetical protein